MPVRATCLYLILLLIAPGRFACGRTLGKKIDTIALLAVMCFKLIVL